MDGNAQQHLGDAHDDGSGLVRASAGAVTRSGPHDMPADDRDAKGIPLWDADEDDALDDTEFEGYVPV